MAEELRREEESTIDIVFVRDAGVLEPQLRALLVGPQPWRHPGRGRDQQKRATRREYRHNLAANPEPSEGSLGAPAPSFGTHVPVAGEILRSRRPPPSLRIHSKRVSTYAAGSNG